jgi:hypothetical protein
MREPLWFSASARLIAGLGRQQRRVKRQCDDLLTDGEVTPADIGDLPLVAAVHEILFFTRFGNWVSGAALPVPAQHQVEDHPKILSGGVSVRQFNGFRESCAAVAAAQGQGCGGGGEGPGGEDAGCGGAVGVAGCCGSAAVRVGRQEGLGEHRLEKGGVLGLAPSAHVAEQAGNVGAGEDEEEVGGTVPAHG